MAHKIRRCGFGNEASRKTVCIFPQREQSGWWRSNPTSAVSLRAAFFGARGSPALHGGNIVLESINTIGDGGCWPRGLAPRVKEKAPVEVLYFDGCP